MFLNFSENVYIYPEIDGYFGDLAFSNLHTIPKQLTFFLNETNISASACCTIDLETDQPRKKKCLYIVWDCNFCMHVNTCLLAWWCGFFYVVFWALLIMKMALFIKKIEQNCLLFKKKIPWGEPVRLTNYSLFFLLSFSFFVFCFGCVLFLITASNLFTLSFSAPLHFFTKKK